jgi:hypothetical protein
MSAAGGTADLARGLVVLAEKYAKTVRSADVGVARPG